MDQTGAPCRGWVVSVTDETEISQFMIPIDSAEGLTRQSTKDVLTDQLGRFQIDGLMDRDYRLQAFHKKSLLRTEQAVRAGTSGAELQVQTNLVSRVTGQVVGLDGSPVPGVSLKLTLPTSVGRVGHASIQGAATITDEEGRFVLNDVPDQFAYLYLHGEPILNGTYEFPAGFGEEEQRVEVERRCHFQMELSGTYTNVEKAWFEDDEGHRKTVNRIEAGGMSNYPWVPLVHGKSQVLSVSKSARTLVLTAGGKEIARISVQLSATEVTQLRP